MSLTRTALYAEMQEWTSDELRGIVACLFLDRNKDRRKYIVDAIFAINLENEEINLALEKIGKEERLA